MAVQKGLPVDVDLIAITRKQTWGKALEECMELAGLTPQKLPFDEGQFSKWKSGAEGIKWSKLEDMMDVCGNDAPLFWMMHMRGWDVHSFRRQETENEARARIAEEKSRAKDSVIADLVAQLAAARR